MVGVLDELVSSVSLLGGGEHSQRRTTVLGVGGGAVSGRHLGHTPLASAVSSGVGQVGRHPSASEQGGDGAVDHALEPVLRPASGLGVEQALVQQLLPEVGEGLDALVLGQVDGDFGTIGRGLERLCTGQPGHGVEEAGVTGVGGDVVVVAQSVNLLGGVVVLIPGLDLLGVNTGLVEDLLVVEEGHWAGIHRQAVDLAGELHGSPRARGVEVGVAGGLVGDVQQVALDGVLRDGVVLNLSDVRSTGASLDGVIKLGVFLGVGADVLEIDLDAGLLGEVLGNLGQRGLPSPHGDFGNVLILSRLATGGVGTAGGNGTQHGNRTGKCNGLLSNGELHRSVLLPWIAFRRSAVIVTTTAWQLSSSSCYREPSLYGLVVTKRLCFATL